MKLKTRESRVAVHTDVGVPEIFAIMRAIPSAGDYVRGEVPVTASDAK